MIRRFSVSIVGRILAALLQVAVFALFARSLGVEAFGVFAATSSLTLGLMTFAELGMGARLLRGEKSSIEYSNLTTFGLTRAAVIILIIPAAIVTASALTLDPLLITAAALYAAGEATGDLAVAILQGSKRSALAMAILCGRRLLVLSALVFLPSPQSVLVACFIGAGAGIVTLGVFVILRRARPRSIVALVRENLGIIVSGGASSAAQFDTILVSQAAGTFTAGLYGSATRLFNPINLAVSTLLQVFVPEIASAPKEDRLRVFRRVRLVVALIGLAIASSAVLAPLFVDVLYGSEFAGAAPVAISVFVCAGMSAVAQAYMAWYYATSLPRSVPLLMWCAVIIGLACIWVLSAHYGVVGSAVGLFVMHLLSTAAVIGPWRSSVKDYS